MHLEYSVPALLTATPLTSLALKDSTLHYVFPFLFCFSRTNVTDDRLALIFCAYSRTTFTAFRGGAY
jgi:hypothetical protein